MEIIWLLVGAIVGSIVTIIIARFTSICTIVIDHSDPDSPYPFLEGAVPLELLGRKKWITAKIRHDSYLSQK